MQREALRLKRKGLRIALVPTMGALHEGHLSLVDRARKEADVVVMSIYVNPTQFGPKEDFGKYPRQLRADAAKARKRGVDILFTPRNLYHEDESTYVDETEGSQGRCGAERPGHFRGVATVVCKLLQIVQPDVAVFGQKDAQQCDVIERMVRDLYIPVKIVRGRLVRDANGLALSSRNQYLTPGQYEQALLFPRALEEACALKDQTPRQVEAAAMRRLRKAGFEVDYVTWANGFLCAVVRMGNTRLLDNMRYKARVAGGRK